MAIEFDKTINVSTVVAVVTLFAAIGGAYATVQSQIAETKTTITMIQSDQAEKWKEIRDDVRELRQDQKEILQRVSK